MEHTYRQTSRIHSVIFIGIIFLLVFAPLAFGSVHVWAYSVVEIGVWGRLGTSIGILVALVGGQKMRREVRHTNGG